MKTPLGCGALMLVLCGCATPGPTEATRLATRATAFRASGCVPDTATRLPVKADECAGFGGSYSQSDLQRTGALDTASALRLLDPALSVRGR